MVLIGRPSWPRSAKAGSETREKYFAGGRPCIFGRYLRCTSLSGISFVFQYKPRSSSRQASSRRFLCRRSPLASSTVFGRTGSMPPQAAMVPSRSLARLGTACSSPSSRLEVLRCAFLGLGGLGKWRSKSMGQRSYWTLAFQALGTGYRPDKRWSDSFDEHSFPRSWFDLGLCLQRPSRTLAPSAEWLWTHYRQYATSMPEIGCCLRFVFALAKLSDGRTSPM